MFPPLQSSRAATPLAEGHSSCQVALSLHFPYLDTGSGPLLLSLTDQDKNRQLLQAPGPTLCCRFHTTDPPTHPPTFVTESLIQFFYNHSV